MIVNITTKQSHYNVYTIIILLFCRPMWSGQWPGARGLGPGLGLQYEIVLLAGPGHNWCGPGRAGPGPHNSICGPGPGRVCTPAAGPGRAWASNNICGPGLVLYFMPVQGPSFYPPLRNDRNSRRGGGVACYVRHGIQYTGRSCRSSTLRHG